MPTGRGRIHQKKTIMPVVLRVKWFLFRFLEFLVQIWARPRANSYALEQTPVAPSAARSLWVFASTIGELNAIGPLLKRLRTRLPHLPLVLLSDHAHYHDSFLAKYPSARFRFIDHRTVRVQTLMDEAPPALVILAEIPCLLSEAPCRLPFALAFEAKRRGAALCLVNGWLYGQGPNSRMDAIEKRLFERDYLALCDVMTVQNDAIRNVLIEAGAHAERVFVTGNLKFDALNLPMYDSAAAKSAELLHNMEKSGRPILIAGCVTNISEQKLVLDAFRAASVLASNPLLVLAPRYPDNAERMDILEKLLSERGYRFAFRSKLAQPKVADSLQCLVLDTLGELMDFYAASTVSYVGLNKNVLEPLAFGRKVIVTSGWDPHRPGFAVYRLLLDKGFITEVQHTDLAPTLLEHLGEIHGDTAAPDFRRSVEYRELIGATDRCMERLEPVLSRFRS